MKQELISICRRWKWTTKRWRITCSHIQDFLFFKYYLFVFRERKGGKKRGKETSMCCCLSHASHWGPGLQPRHVPWLGIELATLWFTGRHSIHWATPAKAEGFSIKSVFFKNVNVLEDREGLKNDSRLEEVHWIWQLNGTHDPKVGMENLL